MPALDRGDVNKAAAILASIALSDPAKGRFVRAVKAEGSIEGAIARVEGRYPVVAEAARIVCRAIRDKLVGMLRPAEYVHEWQEDTGTAMVRDPKGVVVVLAEDDAEYLAEAIECLEDNATVRTTDDQPSRLLRMLGRTPPDYCTPEAPE